MNKEIRILIVEDEFMISEDISMRLQDFGYAVEGIAPSAEEALEILENGLTDLALLDVNIEGEMDGIELSKIISKKYNIPFIFLTSLASNSIVERAKEVNPSAYLLKPFNDRQVQIAIEMALDNFSENKSQQLTEPSKEHSKKIYPPIIPMQNSLFLKKDTHFDRVLFDDIYSICAESNYTSVNTKTEKYYFSCVLKKFEEKLPDTIFVRVHRSFIVNLNHVTGFEGNYLFVGDDKIPISKVQRENIYKLFNFL